MFTQQQEVQEDYNLSAKVISLYNNLKNNRYNLEKLWNQISKYVLPYKYNKSFYGDTEIYDSTAILAAEYLISGLWSFVSSASVEWFQVKLNKSNISYEEKVWLKHVNKIMQDCLSDARSGFYYKTYEFYTDLVCYGTAVFYLTEDSKTKTISYQSIPLYGTYITQTTNKIDTVIRKITLSIKQLVEIVGYDSLYDKHQNIYNNDENTNIDLLHIVAPKDFYPSQKLSLKGMNYLSYYIDMETLTIVSKKGYYEFPYMIARWSTKPGEEYGQSPAMLALPDIKMLNAISKTMLVAAQKSVDPPIMAPHEGAVQGIRTTPGGIIYGALDPVTGNTLLKPLTMGGDLSNSYALQEQRRVTVQEAFYNSILLYNYSPNATATEVLSTNEQKLRIIGSKISRIQTEFLYPMLLRQLHLLKRLDILPRPPHEINYSDIIISFHGSWNKYQQISEKNAIKDTVNSLKDLEHFKEDIGTIINWEEVATIIAKTNSVPETIFNNHKNNQEN